MENCNQIWLLLSYQLAWKNYQEEEKKTTLQIGWHENATTTICIR